MITIDSICDTICEPDFDRTDLPESAYVELVGELARQECAAAFARHQLAERTRELEQAQRDRDALATSLAVINAKRRVIPTPGDEWDGDTLEYRVPPWLQVLRQGGAL